MRPLACPVAHEETDVDHQTFIDSVAQRAGVSRELAETLARVTLEVLADRITGGEARDLLAQLPKPLKDEVLIKGEEAEAFDVPEFVRRVATRANVDEQTAHDGAVAVLITVREAVTPGEFDDITSQLPQDYRELVGPIP
jgi:uncharacterized protein (DUF2267 family)